MQKISKIVNKHFVHGTSIRPPFHKNKQALFGLGCFWGAEKAFWQYPNICSTAVGYTGGSIVNPSYTQVCSGSTGHAESVLVIYDPKTTSYKELLELFWTSHDPTQLNRQGNDIGHQYRSAIFYFDEKQQQDAIESKEEFKKILTENGYGEIQTEITKAGEFYYAEDYHQQYLAKNPGGYCGHGGLCLKK